MIAIADSMKFRLYHLPILTSVWFTGTYIITYLLALYEDHVTPIFPYISSAGTTPPESCIFAFMLCMGAALLFVVIYIRYRLREFCPLNVPVCLNNSSFIMGVISCFGIILVATFQESVLFAVHMLGAFCVFGFANIYICLQTWITWKSEVNRFLKLSRIFLCILLIPSFVCNLIFGRLSRAQFKGTNILKWTWEDGGYSWHLVSTFSEWIMAIILNIYVFTFESEFKQISFEEIVFRKNEIY